MNNIKRVLKAVTRCGICHKVHNACNCWKMCICGWYRRQGEACRNAKCDTNHKTA